MGQKSTKQLSDEICELVFKNAQNNYKHKEILRKESNEMSKKIQIYKLFASIPKIKLLMKEDLEVAREIGRVAREITDKSIAIGVKVITNDLIRRRHKL